MRITHFLALGCLALASAAVAQVPAVTPVVKDKLPDRTVKVTPAPPLNTFRFSPQVVQINGQKKPQRAVKNVFDYIIYDTPEQNTIQLGAMSPTPSPLTSSKLWPAIGATGWIPPDPDIAVGPNHIVCVVNVAIGFFRKDGTPLFQQDLGANGFFSGMDVKPFVFDPKCFYDPISRRFFVVALEQDGASETSKCLVAVSDDSDPTGTWHRYRVEAKQVVNNVSYWLDYPGFGHNADAVVITGNMFGFSGGFNGIQYIVMQKAPMLTGGTPNISYFSLGGGSVQIMRTSNESPDFVYGLNWTGLSTAMIHAIRDPGGTTPSLSTTPVAIPTFRRPAEAAQSTNGHTLDSLDGRMMNVHYRGGRLYGAHTVAMSSSDATNASRWYEFNLNDWPGAITTPTVRQAGTVGIGNGVHLWMPAIGVNRLGDVTLVYSRASSSIVADMVASVRRINDPLGQMGAPITLATSVGSQYGGTSNRWGDYFGVQTDPNDDETFWGIAMIANAGGGWQTVVNSYRVTTNVISAPATVTKYEGGGTVGGLAQVLASDNGYYRIQAVPIVRTGYVASHITQFNLSTTNPSGLRFKIEAAAVPRVTANYFLWNWTTSKWEYVGATPLTSSDKSWEFQAPAPASKFVNGQRQVRMLLRAIMPYSKVYSATSFSFRTDFVQLISQQ